MGQLYDSAAIYDWDGKVLVTIGTSQGGLQSIVAASLNPKVTTCIANVPACRLSDV